MIKNVVPVLGNVEIGESIAVVIAYGDSLAVASGGYTSLAGYITEGTVTVVAVETIAQRRIGTVEIAFAAIH